MYVDERTPSGLATYILVAHHKFSSIGVQRAVVTDLLGAYTAIGMSLEEPEHRDSHLRLAVECLEHASALLPHRPWMPGITDQLTWLVDRTQDLYLKGPRTDDYPNRGNRAPERLRRGSCH